jgi:hypothetical protein
MRVFIKMGTDKDLVAVTPDLLRQPDTDLMRDLRGDLAFGKGLIAVIGYRAVFLAEGFSSHGSISSLAVSGEQCMPQTSCL